MSEQVKVFSAPGRKVPREENPRKYYPAEEKDAVEVARTPYIERMLLTGDLVDAAAQVKTATATDTATATASATPTAVAKPAGKKKE